MTLHTQAQQLAAKGRGPDELLVHMTRREVAGLDALARAHYGRGLTTNPETGLPEAGILGSILPMLAGIALTATGIGAPMAALLVGGGTAAMTGSLSKGLMAGLGAFGGAGMGDALASMGTTAADAAASSAAQTAASAASAPAEAAATMATPAAAETSAMYADPTMWDGVAGVDTPWEAGYPSSGASASAAAADPQAAFRAQEIAAQNMGGPGVTSASAPMSAFDKMGAGAKDMMNPGGFDRFLKAQGGGMKAGMNAMMALQGGMGAGLMTPTQKKFGDDTGTAYIRPYDYDPNAPTNHHFTARPMYPASEAPKRFALGGISSLDHENKGGPTPFPAEYQYNYDPTTQRFSKANPTPPAPAAGAGAAGATGSGFVPGTYMTGSGPVTVGANGQLTGAVQYGEDGPAFLQEIQRLQDNARGQAAPVEQPQMDDPRVWKAANGYADGGIAGLMKGPGDGVSDSIPAQMQNGRQAALGDGEFVVPARIVAEIGNGSSDAGARKLYAMMSRIERQRKQTSMAGNSGAERYLPA